MSKYIKQIAAFIGVQFVVLYVVWMGGFDFDDRNPFIGYLALLGIVLGIGATQLVRSEDE